MLRGRFISNVTKVNEVVSEIATLVRNSFKYLFISFAARIFVPVAKTVKSCHIHVIQLLPNEA